MSYFQKHAWLCVWTVGKEFAITLTLMGILVACSTSIPIPIALFVSALLFAMCLVWALWKIGGLLYMALSVPRRTSKEMGYLAWLKYLKSVDIFKAKLDVPNPAYDQAESVVWDAAVCLLTGTSLKDLREIVEGKIPGSNLKYRYDYHRNYSQVTFGELCLQYPDPRSKDPDKPRELGSSVDIWSSLK